MAVFNKKVGMTSTSTKQASYFLPTAGWAVDSLKKQYNVMESQNH